MFENTKKDRTKVLSLMVVAMFMLTSAALMITGESDAASDTTYTVNMYVGTEYSYTPAVNLSTGIIRYDVTNTNDDVFVTGAGSASTTISLSAPSQQKTDYSTVVLKAVWTASENSSVTQTATQRINFKVYDLPKYIVDGTVDDDNMKTYTVLTNTPMDTAFATIAITGEGTSIDTVAIKVKSTQESTDVFDVAVVNGGKGIVLYTNSDSLEPNVYQVIVEGSSTISSGMNANTISCPLVFTADVIVSDTAMITPSSFFTYYGQDEDVQTEGTQAIRTISTEPANALSDISIAISDSSDSSVIANGVLSDPTRIVFNTSGTEPNGQYEMVSFKMNLDASDSNGYPLSFTQDATLKMYASVKYMSTPSAARNIIVAPVQNNLLNIRASLADIEGATMITYYWGDNSPAETHVIGSAATTTSTQTHTYEHGGIYTITAVVSNDYPGTAPIIRTVTYNTESGLVIEDDSKAVIKHKVYINDADEEILELDGSDSANAVGFKWFKNDVQISTSDKVVVKTSDIEEGDVFTLQVTDNLGRSYSANYEYQIEEESKGFFEEYGYVWIPFIAVGSVLGVAYVALLRDPRVIIGAGILVLIGAIIFFLKLGA